MRKKTNFLSQNQLQSENCFCTNFVELSLQIPNDFCNKYCQKNEICGGSDLNSSVYQIIKPCIKNKLEILIY
jgi:hypothetical protein